MIAIQALSMKKTLILIAAGIVLSAGIVVTCMLGWGNGARTPFSNQAASVMSEADTLRAKASAGDADAMTKLGNAYFEGRLGLAKDYQLSADWYRKAAGVGGAYASTGLGIMYLKGWGVNRDTSEAKKWLQLGYERGDAMAGLIFGNMYLNGEYVAQDSHAALLWFGRAAQRGNATAANNIGYMFGKGEGVVQDRKEAMAWFALAASMGYQNAIQDYNSIADDGTVLGYCGPLVGIVKNEVLVGPGPAKMGRVCYPAPKPKWVIPSGASTIPPSQAAATDVDRGTPSATSEMAVKSPALQAGVMSPEQAQQKPPVTQLPQTQRSDGYNNARFGYVVDYPRDLFIPQQESANGDGRVFLSRNHDATISVSGSHNVTGETISELFRNTVAQHPMAAYKIQRQDWFVVSWSDGRKVFYQKTILADGIERTLRVEYDLSQKAIYDAQVATIAKSFRRTGPGL
jgi:TPR repeat protein